MAYEHGYRPTHAKVNLQAIQDNVRALQAYLAPQVGIIAVVKADGYGHGMVAVAQAALAAGAEMVAVATPDEAIELREKGIDHPILVMGPSPVSFAEQATSLNIAITVSNADWLEQVTKHMGNFPKKLKIHVKIDSGMGRIGIRKLEEMQSVLELLDAHPQLDLEGMFTHFPCADDGQSETTAKQFELFSTFVQMLPTKPRYVHASNSAATLLYPDYHLDAVRFGISLYGIAPSNHVQGVLPINLQPALSLETELAFVKQIEKGQTISYGATYSTAGEEWIGTLPIGYADGLKRGLREQDVLIDGERMPIVGTICMDQCMVKLSREFPVGTKVTLLGKQGEEEITVEEWAERLGTIPYEIVVSLTKRVPRVYA